ncbi:TPA: GAF domain-containing sensor histidine kinase [Candidatus Avigastranaerophilus faecigallinarum]|nr:GAF domain-containing sensor histidine kinase [Candidatus Avigastranaerophilus faecigallinarum]
MENLEFFNNYSDAVCVLANDNSIVFKNRLFISTFSDFENIDKFKKHFNFNLCFLSLENINNKTPIDFVLKSKENFHTICTYQKHDDEYQYYYIYTFKYGNYKIVVFKDITSIDKIESIKKKYEKLEDLYKEEKESTDKFAKLQEHAQAQVLKMGIINRISLVIRETNDIESILSSTLEEINNLLGSFKTYFSMKEKNGFRIKYSVIKKDVEINSLTEYEEEILTQIKNKNIVVSNCLKEFLNSEKFLTKGIKRIIIPVYNKNKLLGIIVTLTRQKFNLDDNKEILQSISVQLASSIIQAGLIQQLNKKNKKLQKTLSELKDTQMQLINTEKMASIGQLVSGVAHEINTPLASINSNNTLIKKILSSSETISNNQLEILKDLNSIDIEAANRISNIVKSLKRFVRLDEAEFQEADINKELDLTLKLIAHEIKDNITIEKQYSELPPILCSVNMLNQVFMNILVNACHSIIDNKAGKIIITTSFDEKFLYVKIKDNGIGIPTEQQNKIFNVGFTTKKIGIGTGLGLSISKKIIELHKGNITFTSKENTGTEFTISIPLNH